MLGWIRVGIDVGKRGRKFYLIEKIRAKATMKSQEKSKKEPRTDTMWNLGRN